MLKLDSLEYILSVSMGLSLSNRLT